MPPTAPTATAHLTQSQKIHRYAPWCARADFSGFGTSVGSNSGSSKSFDLDVLSIAKLRVGQEAYQLSGVAQSLDDYYTGVGEASGEWAGIGAERLGLPGEVTADDLRAVLAGMAPGTGGLTPDGATIRPHRNRVPGFDLTFKAPKSVSVLYGVSDDPRVQHAIVDAGETAARATLAWLEREAIHVRRGSGNAALLNDLAARDPEAADAARLRVVPASGVVAAMFRHRTSRAGDPLLHWHTLVANMAEGPDGRWTALHGADLYRAVRAAGEVFQTVLRDELVERLGVQWRPGRHVPEIAGIPQGLLDQFSKRSKEIEDWLASTGTAADAAGRQAAVLATRRNKPEVEHERFDAAWKAEAEAFGWGPTEAEALLLDPSPFARHADVSDAWIAEVARELTEHDSTFDRNDLVRVVASRFADGGSSRSIDMAVAAVVASPAVVPVGVGGGRWTSAELAGVERRFLAVAAAGVDTRAQVPASVAFEVLDRFPTIGADQQAAVLALAGSSDAVSVLVGPAGTGKTFALDTVRSVYETAGFRVLGAAPSARAAHELEHGARIESMTMHRLLGAWERGFDRPDSHTVLVIDEAAMAGTRELESLVTTTVAAGGRVILVGDHHQLPEVTAGGGFAALATCSLVTVAELSENRRQHHEWERTALAELRDGHVARAVSAYRSHDRVTVAPDRSGMLTAAVDRWSAASADGLTPVLLAGTNSTVQALNLAARERLLEEGRLGESLGRWSGRDLAVGDRVVLRANAYQARSADGRPTPLLNGHTATVLGASPDGVTVRLDHSGTDIVLSSSYLAERGIDYAYALTSHRAQGGTWDLAIAVGADGLYREAGYLALSRGRAENWLVLTQADIDAIDADLVRHDRGLLLPGEEPSDLDAELIRRLSASRGKQLALTIDPLADRVAEAASSFDVPKLVARAARASAAEQRAAALVGRSPAAASAAIERVTSVAPFLAVGQNVKPNDRRNIGVVMAIDDAEGSVEVLFTSAAGRAAERRFRWDEVSIVGERNLAQRPMSADATRCCRPDRRRASSHDQPLERRTRPSRRRAG